MPGISSRFRRALPSVVLAAVVIAILVFDRHHSFKPSGNDEPAPLALGSSSFHDGQIPAAFTCNGANSSPALAWSAPPPGTRTFALVVADRDAPEGSFVHWVLFNLPPETRTLPEAFPTAPQLPDGTRQGRNDFDQIGYRGPCPPDPGAHRYVFSLLALDGTLDLSPGVPPAQLEEATQGHVLARGTLTGIYSH